MNLDLNDLILTEEELSALSIRSYPAEQISGAAVAKALWGLVEYLDAKHEKIAAFKPFTQQDLGAAAFANGLSDEVSKALEAAGIIRPEGDR